MTVYRKVFLTLMCLATLLAFVAMIYFDQYARICKIGLWDKPLFRLLLLADPQLEGNARISREGYYGQLNVAFNDKYFSWIVTRLVTQLKPTHVAVLGDLFSYQSLRKQEFDLRVQRYREIFSCLHEFPNVLLVNVSGNHDIGYGAELDEWHAERFEAAFGPLNALYDLGEGHTLAVVNAQNIDSARHGGLREQTHGLLRRLEGQPRVVLLCHIPLHKPAGSCGPLADEPRVEYDKHGYVEEQTMLTAESSEYIRHHVNPLAVFSGHDHEGCIYRPAGDGPTEYTVRSMMGDYGGFAAVYEAARSPLGTLDYHYCPCPFVATSNVVLWLAASAGLVCIWCGLAGLCMARRCWASVSMRRRGSKIE